MTEPRWRDVLRRRLELQYLARRAESAKLVDVVRQMCGVHAQVMPSAELSLALRVAGLTQAELRAALWERKELVRTYGPRGTVHLLAADDLPLWRAALRARTPSRAANKEELAALPPKRVPDLLTAMRDALDGACLSRAEMATALEERLGPWAVEEAWPAFGGYMPRWQLALSTAADEGILTFGPPRGTQVTYVRPDQWLGKQPDMDGTQALAEVFRRFLHTYGPASHVEFARWIVMLPAAARELQESLADEIEEVDVEGTRLWQLRGTRYRRGASMAHLVPQFDSYVVGCHPRERLIPPAAAERLGRRDTASPFAVLLVDGVVAGLWSRQRKGKQLSIRVDPLTRLSTSHREQVREQASRMGAFLGAEASVSFGHIERRGHL